MKRLLPSFFILLTLVSCTIQKEDFLANHDSKIAVKPVAERMSLDDARSVNTQSSTSEGVVEWIVLNKYYTRDQDGVIYDYDNRFYSADDTDPDMEKTIMKTFGDTPYIRIGNRIYRHSFPVSKADVNTFEPINEDYARDKNHVYVAGIQDGDDFTPILWVDPRTFEILWGWWWRDKNHIYYNGRDMKLDRASFDIIQTEQGIARDKNGVYDGICGKIDHADPKTFEITPAGIMQDAHFIYERPEEDMWCAPLLRKSR